MILDVVRALRILPNIFHAVTCKLHKRICMLIALSFFSYKYKLLTARKRHVKLTGIMVK